MTTDPKGPLKRSGAKSSSRKQVRKNRQDPVQSIVTPVAVGKSASLRKSNTDQPSRQKTGMAGTLVAAKRSAKRGSRPEIAPKPIREKRVRDDFKMPEHDYALISALKQRAREFSRPTKKNELLRAGLQALAAMDNAELQQRLEMLAPTRSRLAVKPR